MTQTSTVVLDRNAVAERVDREIADVYDLIEKLESAASANDRPLAVKLIERCVARLDTNPALYELYGAASGHPSPLVRSYLVEAVRIRLPEPLAADTLYSLVIDPDDIVCLNAIRVAGECRLQSLADYILEIIGPIAGFEDDSIAPVGRGAAHGVVALRRIYGSSDPDAVARIESDYLANGKFEQQLDVEYSVDGDPLRLLEPERWSDMVYVRAGRYTVGLNPTEIPDDRFDWQRNSPRREVWHPPYLIDRYPVTNSQYDVFAESADADSHAFCHPLEPDDKNHARNTVHDRRFGSDHPVTGVDWFDAYAYASWSGKELPTEYEWEIAARGREGYVWPWGDTWDSSAAHWAGTVFDRESMTLGEWRELLSETLFDDRPRTASIYRNEASASPLGVVDMVGNAWEWTRSDLKTGGPFSPSKLSRSNEPISVVIKGGSWSSQPGMMFPSFRGQDAPFCRHDEIGFRCSRPLSRAALHRPPGQINTAIY